MDLSVEEFIDGLLTKEAFDTPSDNVKPDQLILEYPKWYDEKEFNKGRRFFWDNSFNLASSILFGVIAVLAVPSILRILISTRRANSSYTAYKRYLSTLMHTFSWFEYELKPGSISWKSLCTVRKRHVRAGLAAKTKGLGVVSQRDIALTLFAFMGFSVLKPDKVGVRQLKPGEWEAYIHFWRTIGHSIGLQDRYNICRKTFAETHQVCRIILERVITPCLDNPPEYFEYSARVILDGLWTINPSVNLEGTVYWSKHLAEVPGYVYTEDERIFFQKKLMEHLKGKDTNTGVDSSVFTAKPAIELPHENSGQRRLLHLRDYDTIDTIPEYKRIGPKGKNNLAFYAFGLAVSNTYLGRLFFNFIFPLSLLLMKYFPFVGFFRYGVKKSFVNMFEEGPKDDVQPMPNSEYYKEKQPEPWYKLWLSML